MSTLIKQDITKELASFEDLKSTISQMASQFGGLTIAGLDDRKGYDAVHEARMKVKSLRVSIEKRRKELKEESLRVGRLIDSTAKELAELIEPVESHLMSQEKAIDDEKERINREEHERIERERQAKLQTRIDALDSLQWPFNPLQVQTMTDEQFQEYFENCQQQHAEKVEREKAEAEARAKREAEEAERLRVEAERLAKERQELDRIRAEQEAERQKQLEAQRKIDEERQRIEAAKLEEARRVELEQAKQKAAEEAAKRERERIEAERIAEEKRLAKKAEDQRKREARKPDIEKVKRLIDSLINFELPTFKDEAIAFQCQGVIGRCVDSLQAIANELEAQ
jgi:hypothetical protein